jgi:hypothetical protein
VLHAASTLRMIRRRLPAECHSDVTPADLPGRTRGIQHQETALAAQHGSPIALMLRDREAIVSKHEGVLTDASHTLAHHRDRPFPVPLIPAKAGTQSNNGTRAATPHPRTPPWIPAFAGMSGHSCAPKTNAAA